ncbi:MAG: tyrosine-protein phosphatase [Dehalococcoidia bacterium]|nr:tyrosine-protein phosphatase [Dehalococcoidia bacterium]
MREPDGIQNFRTVGAYSLASGGHFRAGMIYRSGALERMSPEDRAWLEGEVGVRTILDLRHPDEVAFSAQRHALGDYVLPLSIFPEEQAEEDLIAELNGLYGPGPSPRRYLHYLDVGGDRLARAFSLFAEEPRYPFLVHCTAGKDRTGVLVGMIMDVVGCTPGDIAAEYALSDASIDRLIAYLRAMGRDLQGSDDEIRARMSTPPERMAGFIDLVREKHGGSEAFFRRQGVPAGTIERVRSLLTA